MILDQRVTIPASPSRVWDFMMDMSAVSQCVPGVESIEEVDDDNYVGTLKVRVGPIRVELEGRITFVERNSDDLRATINVEAADRRIRGAVNATSTMTLEKQDDGGTGVVIHTNAAILGKLGEFGQAVMRRKADQIMLEFAKNMAREIVSTP